MAHNDIPDPAPFDRHSDEASLAFDIAFAVPRAGIRGLRRAFHRGRALPDRPAHRRSLESCAAGVSSGTSRASGTGPGAAGEG